MTKIDVTTCDDATQRTAKVFYQRYCENSDGLNFRGEPCPDWDVLPANIQSHWCAVALLASDAAMRVVREFVNLRLDHMATRPMMFATTKESLGVQLILLAEMVLRPIPAGLSATAELSRLLWGPTSIVPAEPIDGAWAQRSVALTKAFLEEKCGR